MPNKYAVTNQRELITLILLSTVQSVMSLRIAGSTFEKFRLTNTLHPSLGRGSSVISEHNIQEHVHALKNQTHTNVILLS
jgi:hypothetical protein